MRTMFDAAHRALILERLRGLTADTPRRWGTMRAPQMVAHLTDQMRHTLGDAVATPARGPLRFPPLKFLSIYVMPWPRGRIKGPPDAFVTHPVEWSHDLAALEALVERLGERSPLGSWPDHALFGRMTGSDWGFFVHKHFDHHLRQFGR